MVAAPMDPRIIIVSSFAWLLVSFWNRNDLPKGVDFVPEVQNNPLQTPTRKSAFVANYNDVEYVVEPEYEYDLYGMIVSFRHHDDSRIHLLANDHLNMLDVCVIWGDNTTNPSIHEMNFWNGIFTCMVEAPDRKTWESFDMHQVSNNHLISDDEFIRDRVRSINVGDQIHVRGYLASYSSEAGGKRGTSTTRTDTGNGACETVYVEEFVVLEAATSYWRMSMYLSLLFLTAGLVVHFKRPYRPYQNA